MVVASPFVRALSGITATSEEVITIRRTLDVRRAELRILVVPCIAGMIKSRSGSVLFCVLSIGIHRYER